MSQIARPDSDISVGSWSPYPASPTTLFDKIDEETKDDDTTYIVSSTDEDECEVGLTDVTDPEVGISHKIRCYAKSVAGAGAGEQMYIALVENGTERARSATANVNRNAYGLIEYTLSEAEANAIQNYANLRLRFHITKTDADEPIRITQAEFECPDAVSEFVYAGDVPVSILPDDPKGMLSKSYAGDIPLSARPSYASILDRIYTGAISLAVLPDAPVAPLSKSYGGDISFILMPNSTYELVSGGGEFVYAGDVLLALIGSSPTGILNMIYGGAVSLAILPDAPIAPLEKSYEGDIPVIVLPSYTSILDRIYSGDLFLSVLSGYSSILDRVYSGDIPLTVLPDFPKAILEKSYNGNISLIIVPNSIYEFLGLEFVYSGNIPLSVLPDYSSALDIIYGGDIGLAVIPTSDYGLKAFIEVVKTVFLKSRLTERLQELKSPIKPSIILSSEIKPEGEK